MLAIDPKAQVFKFDNPVLGQETSWPGATAENLASVIHQMGALARPQDKVIVLISTQATPRSLPQVFVGSVVSDWAEQRFDVWQRPP